MQSRFNRLISHIPGRGATTREVGDVAYDWLQEVEISSLRPAPRLTLALRCERWLPTKSVTSRFGPLRGGLRYEPNHTGAVSAPYPAEGVLRAASWEYGLQTLGYFGSYARGEASETSDIDIVFEGDKPNLFLTAMLKQDLEEWLGRPVDVLQRGMVNDRLKARIQAEAVYV